MKTASATARYLAGVIFLVFGLNGFLNFIPLPPPGGLASGTSWADIRGELANQGAAEKRVRMVAGGGFEPPTFGL